MLVDFEERGGEVFPCGGLRRELSTCVEREVDFDESIEELLASGELWWEALGPERVLSSEKLGCEFTGPVMPSFEVAGG